MSLESEIKALTGAMTRLAESVESLLKLDAAAPSEKQQWLDSAPGTAAPQSVVAPRKSEAREPAATSETTQASAPGSTGAAPLSLEDIKKALMATAAKFDAVTGTAKSKAILQRFGAQKLSQVAVDNYAEFIELCESVAAGGEV
jgi:hypothetical protein